MDILLEQIKEHQSKRTQHIHSLQHFIQQNEMKTQFLMNQNIYQSFATIYQSIDSTSGDQFKFVRHFYYDKEDDNEEEEDEEENDKNIDIQENEETGMKSITIDIDIPLQQKKKHKMKSKEKSTVKPSRQFIQKSKPKEETDDDFTDEENTQLVPFKPKKYHSSFHKMKKPIHYSNFHCDVVFYYHIKKDNNEMSEEYNYDNHKLKSFYGEDLDTNTLDDDFMQYSEEVNSYPKVPLTLKKNYFDTEFQFFNVFSIHIPHQIEKIGLGDYLKQLWLKNTNISVYDSIQNFFLNRFYILDNYMKQEYPLSHEITLQDFINRKIHKEFTMDEDFHSSIGKYNFDYAILNRASTDSLHEIGVFMKIIYIFMMILDRTTPLQDEELHEMEFENELRFSKIQLNEKKELQHSLHQMKLMFHSLQSHFDKKNEMEKECLEKMVEEKEGIFFGMKIKLWNRFMKEWIHKYFYQMENKEFAYLQFCEKIKTNLQQTDFIQYYQYSDIYHEMNSITGNLLHFS
jgi:hypothetical protein